MKCSGWLLQLTLASWLALGGIPVKGSSSDELFWHLFPWGGGGGLLYISVILFLPAFRRWKLETPNSVSWGKKMCCFSSASQNRHSSTLSYKVWGSIWSQFSNLNATGKFCILLPDLAGEAGESRLFCGLGEAEDKGGHCRQQQRTQRRVGVLPLRY